MATSTPTLLAQAVGPSVELYVGGGVDAGNNGQNPMNPLATITRATQLAAQLGAANTKTTINVVGGGVFGTANGEAPVISIPAFGVTIESWKASTSIFGLSILRGSAFLTDVILRVDRVGNTSLPSTVIQGLTFTDLAPDSVGLEIVPHQMAPNPGVVVAVEVRDCAFVNLNEGLFINTVEGWTSRHIIEGNIFRGRSISFTSSSLGALERCTGIASTLYRANDFACFEENLVVVNNDEMPGLNVADRCQPRIMCNFVQVGEFNINLIQCKSLLINNTIGFSFPFSGGVTRVDVRVEGGSAELRNNIIWSREVAAWAHVLPSAGAIVNPLNQGNNFIGGTDLEAAQGNGPGFVNGDIFDNQGHFFLRDMHLAPASPMIGAGDNLAVMNLALPASPSLPSFPQLERSTPSGPVRTDINMDADSDPRVLLGPGESQSTISVDIGADEVHVARLELPIPTTPSPTFHDPRGNLIPTSTTATTSSFAVPLDFTGPPNATWQLFFGLGFTQVVQNPTTSSFLKNTAVYQNLWSGSGNFLLDPNPSVSPLFLSGTFDVNGDAVANVVLQSVPAQFIEFEFYLQGLILDPATGLASFSNRVRLELNPAGQ